MKWHEIDAEDQREVVWLLKNAGDLETFSETPVLDDDSGVLAAAAHLEATATGPVVSVAKVRAALWTRLAILPSQDDGDDLANAERHGLEMIALVLDIEVGG